MATLSTSTPPTSRLSWWTARFDSALGAIVQLTAACLVLTEVALLLVGVAARYLFHRPITWLDELVAILFLWLAMLGAVVAFRRGEHMRMTALVARVSPAARPALAVAVSGATLALLLMLIGPALDYAFEESVVTTRSLEISNAWRAAALPAGIGLMLVSAGLRLVKEGRPVAIVYTLLVVVLLMAFSWLGAPLFQQLGNLNLLIFFVGVVAVGVFAGMPIAFAFGLAICGYMALVTQTPQIVLIGRIDEGMSQFILLSVPLFVLLGMLVEMTGMARVMVAFLVTLCGHVRGGLHYVLIGAMYLVSGISGSKAADMAAVAPVLFPEMRKRGADPGDLVALLSATGAQTETVPPSLVLITVGSVTGVSISALFTGGLLPSLLLAIMLGLVVWRGSRTAEPLIVGRCSSREVGQAFLRALPALALPVIIRAVVVEGVATATEVSTIGILYATLVGLLLYRQFDWARLKPMLIETASLSGAILLIIGTATGMAWGLTQSGFSRSLAKAIIGLPGGAVSFMAASMAAFVVLGSVLEGIPAIVLFGPLLFPVARGLGINEVHYAIVVILAMGIGLFAPPFGVGYYTACTIGRVDPAQGVKQVWFYLAALVAGTVVIAAVPWLSVGFLK